MVTLTMRIEIGEIDNELVLDYVHECEIMSTWEDITSTAKITIGKNVYVKSPTNRWKRFVPAIFTGDDAIIKKRDKVRIYAGYNGDFRLLFQGYVSRVEPEIPITIHCEDVMYLLKQKLSPSFTIESASIKAIMKKILPINPETGNQYGFEAEDITVGKIVVEKNVSVIEVLEFMKRRYGIMIYYKNGIIYAGFRYTTSEIDKAVTTNIPTFHFQHNIIDGKGLEFTNADDIFYRIQVINIKQKNNRTEKTVGDLDGETRTLHFYNAKDEDLEKLANEQLKRLKYTGFRGGFETFLMPRVEHGNAIRIVDDLIEDRNGVYVVKGVKTVFGVNGGRQLIELDRAIQ